MTMRLFVFLLLTAFTTWRDAYNRRNPAIVAHAVRWASFSTLLVALYWFLLLPLLVMLHVIHDAPHDAAGDVIHLDGTMRALLLGTTGLMIGGSALLSGYAKSVMAEFADYRWTLLILGTAAALFLLYIGYVVTMTTSLLDVSKGDNGLLAVFMVAWAWSITRICNAPIDRARDSWDRGIAAARR
jgi:hypothetical protein